MKLSKKLTPIALAVSMAVGGLAVPTLASAEVGYNATVASMYLWRGTDASDGPTMSGGIDYSHESGLYASTWVSSGVAGSVTDPSDATPGYEWDIWVGYAGEAGGVGYDISYWNIDYPQTGGDAGNELALGLSYMDFSFGYVMNTDSDSDYTYTTLGYSYDAFGITYGAVSNDGADYSHVDLSFAATDSLSFTLSLPSDDGEGVSEEELIMVSYSLPL